VEPHRQRRGVRGEKRLEPITGDHSNGVGRGLRWALGCDASDPARD
jgi:hypothetical protein